MSQRERFEHIANVAQRCFEIYDRSLDTQPQRIWYDLYSATIAVAYEEWHAPMLNAVA